MGEGMIMELVDDIAVDDLVRGATFLISTMFP